MMSLLAPASCDQPLGIIGGVMVSVCMWWGLWGGKGMRKGAGRIQGGILR